MSLVCSSSPAGLFMLYIVCVLPRGDIPADGSGDSGGAGLVSGPAGDHSDPPLSQRDGLQQGAHLSTHTIVYFHPPSTSVLTQHGLR